MLMAAVNTRTSSYTNRRGAPQKGERRVEERACVQHFVTVRGRPCKKGVIIGCFGGKGFFSSFFSFVFALAVFFHVREMFLSDQR